MATMLAARLYEVRKMLLEEVPKPTPGPGEAVVRVKACGICQTDFCAYTGARMNWRKGMIVGHEMSGVVDEVGRDVIGFGPGDDVIICPAFYCGRCHNCRSGLQHYCEYGGGIGGEGFENVWDGGFAEYVRVPAMTLYHKPASIPFPTAAITEPLAGSYKGLILYSQMTVAEDVVIIGAGSMGLLLTQIARSAGAGTLTLVDVVDFRLQKAVECGASHVINAAREDAKARIHDILPHGPDLVFEAAGAMPAAQLTYELCRRGTRINMFGVIVPGEISVSPAHIHFTEIRMDASFSITPKVMLKSIRLMEKGLADPGKIITHRVPLTRIQDALDVMETPERVKVVVEP